MMESPLISIIVPCYNQAKFLDECLQSVLNQSYSNWECIIVNDGSPDNTKEVTGKWLEKDTRFIYYAKENGGVSSARNFGIERARGEWILPLDGDDKIGKDYLLLASHEFIKNPHIIYCKGAFFGIKSGEMIMDHFNEKDLLLENPIFCTSLFRKQSWRDVNGYDETMKEGYEDWDFWIHLYEKYGHLKVEQINYTGFYYRIKETSRNTEAIQNHDENLRFYLITKYSDLYHKNIVSFSKHLADAKTYKKENIFLKNKLNSKRYKFIDTFLRIFKI